MHHSHPRGRIFKKRPHWVMFGGMNGWFYLREVVREDGQMNIK